MPKRRLVLSFTVISALALTVSAQEFLAPTLKPTSWTGDECRDACAEEERICYGPCDCQPRGTLFQWSHCASFSGGPDLSEPLITDRPDFTESAVTVGRGVAQLEMGYTYAYDDDGTDQTTAHSYPETLLRYGFLAEWLELRFGWNYGDQTVVGGTPSQASGSEDIYLGLKIALTPQEGWLPEMTIIPQMNVPTGAAAFTAGEIQPGLNWVYSWAINDFLSTAGSSQFNRALDPVSSTTYYEFAQSWTIAYALSDRVGGYTEWYAFFPSAATTAQVQHYFNGGFTYLLSNDVQLDIRGGVGMNDAAVDYFVGTGISIRFH